MFGYVISEIRNIKCILYLLGPKDTGKSIILRLLEYLVGKEASSSLSFEQLSSPDYLVKLLGKRLNVSGETSELTLKRLDILKKLSGGDTLTVRGIYEQPIDFVNSSALVFAGNHLPMIKGNDYHNAFTERLVIIPLENPIPKNQQDIHLFEKLCSEIDYIAYWSLFGFHRWKNNNFEFTKLPEVIEVQKNYKKKNDTIRNFIQDKCIFDANLSIYSDELLNAYEIYCKDLGVIPRSDKEFHSTLKTYSNLNYSRFRMDNMNKNGYKGLQLKSNTTERKMFNAY